MASGKSSILAVMCLQVAVIAVAGQDQKLEPSPSGLTIEVLDHMTRLPSGLMALPKPPIPRDNPQTQSKIDLGRMLFLDKRLSPDGSISCATCHNPDKAYSDGRARAVGIKHIILGRRSPSLLNSAYNSAQFWDGRVKTLEDQALVPVFSRNEMGMPDPNTLLARLKSVPEYRRRFQTAFGRDIILPDIQRAIAAFERTLVTPDSAFDRYASGDKGALTGQQKRGLILFIGKASCSQYHNGPNFTDSKFHSLGTCRAGPGTSTLDGSLSARIPQTSTPSKRPACAAPLSSLSTCITDRSPPWRK